MGLYPAIAGHVTIEDPRGRPAKARGTHDPRALPHGAFAGADRRGERVIKGNYGYGAPIACFAVRSMRALTNAGGEV